MDEKKKEDLKEKIISRDRYEPRKEEMQIESPDIKKLKTKLDNFAKGIVKKFKFTMAIGILPKNSNVIFEEEEGLPKDVIDSKPMHIVMLIPEDEFKNIPKIKVGVIELVKKSGENLWVHIKTPVDLWHYGLDSRFEFIDAISASFPIIDKGFLGALRMTNIHKSLVMRTFDRYVTSYVIAGSLVRGTAGENSDVDVFIIIDDTDVKRMSRIELKDKLTAKIYDYVREAVALAGVKNSIHPQVYLLTDFWQSVRDANPVMFTFIRDGIPLYDRGTFIPWKRLLLMGKIKPSPEAIEQYLKEGERTEELVKRRLLDAMVDVYYGVVTPTQAMMMLVGEPPPVPKTIVDDVKKVMVDREKVMTVKDLKTLDKAVKLFKDYEHGKLKEFSGMEIDKFVKEFKDYTKMIKSLREKIEVSISKKTAEEIYTQVFATLKNTFGNKSQEELMKDFGTLVKEGKIRPKLSSALNNLVSVKRKLKSGKLNQREVDSVKRDAFELIDALVEYSQRQDLICKERGTMQIVYGKDKKAELVLMGGGNNFLIEPSNVRKISKGKLVNSSREEFERSFLDHKGKLETKVPGEVFLVLEKELGEFEIVF